MSLAFDEPEHLALRDWEAAKAEAARLRLLYREARDFGGGTLIYVPLAIRYAQAADNAEILRARYEDLAIEAMRRESECAEL